MRREGVLRPSRHKTKIYSAVKGSYKNQFAVFMPITFCCVFGVLIPNSLQAFSCVELRVNSAYNI